MLGPYAEVSVQGAGGLMADPDHPRPAALAADPDLPAPQVEVAGPRVVCVIADPGQPPARIPVAVSTAMIAALRLWAKP
jgi:hypothetical protein